MLPCVQPTLNYVTNIKQVSFVFALCLGGHLGNLLNRTPNKYLPEDTTKLIVRQLASAVAHLHSVGICHRDIKLQNILLEAGDEAYPQIKLIDFGFACRYPGVLPLTTRCGTAYCTAPEVFRENYDERCDVWSISVVTYALLCGHKPFSSVEIPGAAQSGKAAVVTNILMGRYHFNYFPFKKVSSEGIEFIEKLFEPNYHARCTACQVLNLPWLLSASSGPPAAAMTLKNTPLSSAISTLCRKGTHSKIGNTGMVAVAFSSTDDGCPELRTIFQRFDKENNGFLSLKEFRNVMKSINDSLANKDIDTLFKAIDVDNDKQISFTEFLAATLDPRQVDTQEVNKAFQLLDCDNKGYLTVDDFYRVLAVTPEKYKLLNLSKGLSRSDSDEISDIVSQDTASESFQNEREKDKLLKKILEMITAADANKDGVISYSEFLLGVMGAETTEEMDAFDQASNAFNISKTAGKNSAILSQRSDAFFAKLYGPKVSSGNRHQSHPTMRVSGIQSLRKSFSNCELNSPKYSTVHCGDYTDTPSKRMASLQSEPDRLRLVICEVAVLTSPVA